MSARRVHVTVTDYETGDPVWEIESRIPEGTTRLVLTLSEPGESPLTVSLLDL